MPKVNLECDPDSMDRVSRDYDDFCAQWEGRIRRIVLSYNSFQPCDVNDVVQDMMLEFYAKDALGQYDPTRGTRFSTWVHGFVAKRLLGKRDRLVRQAWREGLSLAIHLEDDTEQSLLDLVHTDNPDLSVEFADMVTSVYRQLKKTPVTSVINDFPKLFACIVQQTVYGPSEDCIEALGERQAVKQGHYGVNRKALAYELGISESGVAVMLNRLAEMPAVAGLLGRS